MGLPIWALQTLLVVLNHNTIHVQFLLHSRCYCNRHRVQYLPPKQRVR